MKIDLKNCTLFIRRTSYSNSPPAGNGDFGDFTIVRFGEGDFTFDPKTPFQYELDRGKLDDVRRGAEQPLEVSFTGKFEQAISVQRSGGSGIVTIYRNQLSILEALKGRMADGVSQHPWLVAGKGIEREAWLGCSPYCVTLELHNDLRHECPDSNMAGEAYLFRYFRSEGRNCSLKGGTIQVQGKCNMLRPHVINPFPQGTQNQSLTWLYKNGAATEGGVKELPIPFLSPYASGSYGSYTLAGSGDWPIDKRTAAVCS